MEGEESASIKLIRETTALALEFTISAYREHEYASCSFAASQIHYREKNR